MRFKNPNQQSFEQVGFLGSLARKKRLTQKEAFFLLVESSKQGLKGFPHIHSYAKKHIRHPDALAFIKRNQHLWSEIQKIDNLQKNFLDSDLVESLYTPDQPFFELGAKSPKKLIIIFTTMFNNFGVSNLVFVSLLQNLGASLLVLKDASVFNYLKGIPGYGENFEDSISSLLAFIEAKKFENIYITGYSSGGFAALVTSTMIPCDGVLGFSVVSDLSPNSKLYPGKYMTKKVLQAIPENLQIDIAAALLQDTQHTQRRIFYGSISEIDKSHVLNIIDSPRLDAIELEGCTHQTPQDLLIHGKLLGEFELMIS